MKFMKRFRGKDTSRDKRDLDQERFSGEPTLSTHPNTLEPEYPTHPETITKAEQNFDVILNQVTKLSSIAQSLAKNTRRLSLFSAVSALWLWFYSFQGLVSNWSWMTNASLVILLAFLVPSVLVFGLYFIMRQASNLPNSFRDMKQDILNSDDGALSLFAQKNRKHSLLTSWKIFGVIKNFRELLQTFPILFTKYRSVLTLSNPLLAMLLVGSVVACFLINGLALLTFTLWITKRF